MTAVGQTPQNMAALARANKIRVANARTKKHIAMLPQADGFFMAAAVLNRPSPAQLSMQVFGLLTAVDRVGEGAATKIMRNAGILNPTKRIRDLTPRQRRQIADWMGCEAERREFERQARA